MGCKETHIKKTKKTKKQKEVGMERVFTNETSLVRALLPAFLIVGLAFSLVIISYGLDSIVPGAVPLGFSAKKARTARWI
jgi:hypothetical protein